MAIKIFNLEAENPSGRKIFQIIRADSYQTALWLAHKHFGIFGDKLTLTEDISSNLSAPESRNGIDQL